MRGKFFRYRFFTAAFFCVYLLTVSLSVSAMESDPVTTYSGSVTRTVYNADGQSASDYFGISRGDVLRTLRPHINDSYYLGTPYAGTDYRNPNGDPAGYGENDEAGVPAMNCTGFVWHVLTSAGGKNVPGYTGWSTLLQENNITYITYVDSSTWNSQALRDAVIADAEPGDIIWSWEGPVSYLENGLSTVKAVKHHVGIYIGDYFSQDLLPSNPTGKWNCTSQLAWWHSTDHINGEELTEGTNMVSELAPKTAYSMAYTLIKLDGELTGNLQLTKTSSLPELSQDNAVYDLAGAIYGVYSDSDCTQKVAELETDSSGCTNTLTLKEGSYWIKEISPPKGFALDTQIYPAAVKCSETTAFTVSDAPQYNPVDLLLQKVTSETQEVLPQNHFSLENAEFTVHFYDGIYTDDPSKDGQQPSRNWILKTDAEGICKLTDNYKVSGDPFFIVNEQSVLPLGTITIQETKAPAGYLLNEQIYVCQITSDGTGETISTFQTPTISEAPVRGSIHLLKTDAVTKAPLENAVFEIIAAEDFITPEGDIILAKGEVADTITTDENGCAESKSLYLGTYLVREIQAPEGYLLSENEVEVTLEYQDQNTPLVEVELEISNEPIPEEPAETPAPEPDFPAEETTPSGTAKTGDSQAFLFPLILLMTSGAILVLVFIRKRKNRNL